LNVFRLRMAAMELIPLMHPAELLQDLIDGGRINVKALAGESGYESSHIRRMVSGERIVPIAVFRAAFRLTCDFRIPALILAGSNWALTNLTHVQPAEVRDPLELIPKASASVRSTASCLDYVAKIVADGKVDHYDDIPLNKLKQHHADDQRNMGELIASLELLRARSGGPS